jgi:hypothetical protein
MGFTSRRGRSIPPESVGSAADLDAWDADEADAYDALPTEHEAAVSAIVRKARNAEDVARYRALGLPDEPPF